MTVSRRKFIKWSLGAAVLAGSTYYGVTNVLGRTVFSVLSEKQQVPVFLYHRIGSQVDDMTITPERFEADMIALQQAECHALSQQEWLNYLAGERLPERSVLITFDDGYFSDYAAAFPLLAKYGQRALFFVIAGFVGQSDRLGWPQIQEMMSYGMDIGSHTVSHNALAGLNETELRRELADSRKILEDHLGREIQCIAYPCGSYNEQVLRMTKKCGYEGGFTTRYGVNDRRISPFEFRRIPLFHFDRSLEYVLVRRGWLTPTSV